jgi:uncharacterized RDD family membrane protein YckC
MTAENPENGIPNDYNPYSAMPLSSNSASGFGDSIGSGYPLASLGKRFLGALLDSFVPALCMFPGFVMLLVDSDLIQAILEDSTPDHVGTFAIVGMAWIAIVVMIAFVLTLYLLATRSQSIGKYFIKTQIHTIDTNEPANFIKTFLLRGLLNNLIASVLGCIPFLGLVYQIVDACFIFREDRRCLHDLIAGTKVVDIS